METSTARKQSKENNRQNYNIIKLSLQRSANEYGSVQICIQNQTVRNDLRIFQSSANRLNTTHILPHLQVKIGTSLLEMFCCTLSTGCSPDNLCLGWGCPTSIVRAPLVDGLCGGCGPLTFVVGLWWDPVNVWPCGAYRVWVDVFSLCGCEMISRLLPQMYLHFNVLFQLNLFTVPFPLILISLPGCSFKVFLGTMSLFFFWSFSFNIFGFGIIFGSLPFSFLVSPKNIAFVTFESLFFSISQLAQVFRWQILFQQNIYFNYVALSAVYL